LRLGQFFDALLGAPLCGSQIAHDGAQLLEVLSSDGVHFAKVQVQRFDKFKHDRLKFQRHIPDSR
jgi:hypothetical protein